LNAAPELAEVFANASRIVSRVIRGESLATNAGAFGREAPLRGATMDMVYGTLRRYGRGDALLKSLAHRGLHDPAVRSLLLCALYAIESGSYAEHTAVDQAVRACGLLQEQGAKNFINALLRRFLRERGGLEAQLASDPVARLMHPAWWIEAVRNAHPDGWEAVLSAGNAHPPMGLRVNRRRSSAARFLENLTLKGIGAHPAGSAALVLDKPMSVERLPGFAEGEVSIQDAGAQRAADYLDIADGQHVLDACAAPGGKTGHLLELADVDLLAIDADAGRCERISQNLDRLGLAARIMTADCARPEDWWDGRLYDRILADVPCTASGIVRRHPDIKWLRRPGDAVRFASEQLRILDGLWRVLAPGGKLLYVTCSVFPEENAAVVEAFCAPRTGVRRLDLPGNAPPQLLPGADNDGFFYALLQK
jgi:16S rRNA (cytosine967-C5)-methyltransferase